MLIGVLYIATRKTINNNGESQPNGVRIKLDLEASNLYSFIEGRSKSEAEEEILIVVGRLLLEC